MVNIVWMGQHNLTLNTNLSEFRIHLYVQILILDYSMLIKVNIGKLRPISCIIRPVSRHYCCNAICWKQTDYQVWNHVVSFFESKILSYYKISSKYKRIAYSSTTVMKGPTKIIWYTYKIIYLISLFYTQWDRSEYKHGTNYVTVSSLSFVWLNFECW